MEDEGRLTFDFGGAGFGLQAFLTTFSNEDMLAFLHLAKRSHSRRETRGRDDTGNCHFLGPRSHALLGITFLLWKSPLCRPRLGFSLDSCYTIR
jgi:hypothetical protein